MSWRDKHIPQDNYTTVTKDSRLLARQITKESKISSINGNKAMDEKIDSFLSIKQQIDRKATVNRSIIKQLQLSQKKLPQILLNEYGTVAQEFIDQIHDSEGRRVEQGVNLMKDNFYKWVREKQSPINQRTLVNLALIDDEEETKQRQVRLRQRTFEKRKDRLRDLQEICKKYSMLEFTTENYPMSDRALLEQFLHSNQNAYLSFKKCADFDRMFQRNAYKDQRKPQRIIKQEQLLKDLTPLLQNESLKKLNKESQGEQSQKENERYSKMEGDLSELQTVQGSIDLQNKPPTLSNRIVDSFRSSQNASNLSLTKSNKNPIKIADGIKVNSFNRVLKQAIRSPINLRVTPQLHQAVDMTQISNGDLKFQTKKNSVVTENSCNFINKQRPQRLHLPSILFQSNESGILSELAGTDDEQAVNVQSMTSLNNSFDNSHHRSVENVFLTYQQRSPSHIKAIKFKQAIDSLLASTQCTMKNSPNKQFLETITSLPEINDRNNRSPKDFEGSREKGQMQRYMKWKHLKTKNSTEESHPENQIKQIIKEIGKFRGIDPTYTKIDKLLYDVQRQLLEENFRTDYNLDTAQKVQQFEQMHPRVLKWMFDQMDETLIEDSVTQRQVIKEFDRRKLDTKYFSMLATKKKKQV